MTDPLAALPSHWKITVTIIRGGGLDDDGEPLRATETPLPGCLVAPATLEDPLDRSQLVSGEAVLYTPRGSDIRSTDRIRTPDDSIVPGLWAVNGAPVAWPLGVQVNLTRE